MTVQAFKSYRNLICLGIYDLIIAVGLMGYASFSLAAPVSATPQWGEVEIGIIGMASEEILNDAIAEAELLGHAGLVVVLDTPGGVLETTRKMVQKIMDSPIPIVVWVGPSGARAGSAGAFITMAGHVAAMAPGANIGAAHPVQGNGQDIDEGDMRQKIENDTLAFIQAIAEVRGRDKEMASSFVINSVSLTAKEAKAHNVIDLIVDDAQALLKAIDKREVKLKNDKILVLDTENAILVVYKKSLRQQLLEILSNPNLFYLLFIVGIIGLGFELTHPGSLLPGVVGGICMLLALIATSVLPINFGAMLLVIAGVIFIVAESFVPSFGALGIGGIIAFVMGSFLLIDPANEQGLRIAWTSVLPASLLMAGFGGLTFFLVVKSEKSSLKTGGDALEGRTAVVVDDFLGSKGQIIVDGEYWSAECRDQRSLSKGETINILAREGLKLLVSRSKS